MPDSAAFCSCFNCPVLTCDAASRFDVVPLAAAGASDTREAASSAPPFSEIAISLVWLSPLLLNPSCDPERPLLSTATKLVRTLDSCRGSVELLTDPAGDLPRSFEGEITPLVSLLSPPSNIARRLRTPLLARASDIAIDIIMISKILQKAITHTKRQRISRRDLSIV